MSLNRSRRDVRGTCVGFLRECALRLPCFLAVSNGTLPVEGIVSLTARPKAMCYACVTCYPSITPSKGLSKYAPFRTYPSQCHENNFRPTSLARKFGRRATNWVSVRGNWQRGANCLASTSAGQPSLRSRFVSASCLTRSFWCSPLSWGLQPMICFREP
jgi:hypothetical protein